MASGGVGPGGVGAGRAPAGPIVSIPVSSATVLTGSALGKYVVCNGALPYPVTLPSAVGNDGVTIGIRIAESMTSLVTLTGSGSDLIDGEATRIMWAGETALLVSDGTNWHKLSGVTIPMVCSMRLNAVVPVTGGNPAILVPWSQTDSDNTGLMADTTAHAINFVRPGNYDLTMSLLIASLAADGTVSSQSFYGAVNLFVGTSFGKSGGAASISDSRSLPVFALNPYTIQFSSDVNCDLYGSNAGNASTFSATEVPAW